MITASILSTTWHMYSIFQVILMKLEQEISEDNQYSEHYMTHVFDISGYLDEARTGDQ